MSEILETLTLHWNDEADCRRSARALAAVPCISSALILLEGPLGAGKTTWVRHLLQALGVSGRIKSPTFALMETYLASTGPISHLDFYRFERPTDWQDAGLREVLSQAGLKLIEWPSKAHALPTADLHLSIEPCALAHAPDDSSARLVRAAASTPCGVQLLGALGRQGPP